MADARMERGRAALLYSRGCNRIAENAIHLAVERLDGGILPERLEVALDSKATKTAPGRKPARIAHFRSVERMCVASYDMIGITRVTEAQRGFCAMTELEKLVDEESKRRALLAANYADGTRPAHGFDDAAISEGCGVAQIAMTGGVAAYVCRD